MGRKATNKITICKCGEPSYIRVVKTRNTRSANDNYRSYYYWVHINKQTEPKKHYKGPVDPHRDEIAIYRRRSRERKSEDERIRERRFNYPSNAKIRPDLPEFNKSLLCIIGNIMTEFNEMAKNRKKLYRLLNMFPLSEPPHIKKLQLEKKLPHTYKWENGVEEKAKIYNNKFKEEFDSLHRLSAITSHDIKNAMFDYEYDNKHNSKEKSDIFLDKVKTFSIRTAYIEVILKYWNEILRCVTDERSGESLMGWLKIAEDKLIHGINAAAARNPILTGEYIMRLGKQPVDKKGNIIQDRYPKTVEIVPIKREFTPKQVEDKTRFDIANTVDMNYKYKCERCGFGFDTEKINPKDIDRETLVKIDKISNEIRHKIRNQMDNKLLNYVRVRINNLKENPLSQFVEIVFNNVITEIRKSPQQFYKEQIKKLYRKDVTEHEIANLKAIEVAPENMDIEKIDERDLHKITYSMKQGRAARRHHKSPYFSEQA